MKIGIISDIHNNSIALKAALEEFNKNKCKMIICAGDIIGIGPDPSTTVDILMKTPKVIAVKGNHESYLDNMDRNSMGPSEFDYHLWEHQKLSKDAIFFLSNLEDSKLIEVERKKILVVHYPDLSILNKDFILDFEGKELEKCFSNYNADIVIFGHTHKAIHIITDECHYINPGSLGCHNHNKKTASAGILTIEDEISYEQINIGYDISIVTESIKQLQYPAYLEILKIFFNSF